MNLGDIFLHYEVSPTTWFYLSSLMIVGIFFKFNRVLSVRNMDLLALLLFGPGLLLLMNGSLPNGSMAYVRTGYIIMFVTTVFFVARTLSDCLMVRRPLLEPNLDAGGLRFTSIALMIFLAGSIAISVSPLELIAHSPVIKQVCEHPVSLENALKVGQLHRTPEDIANATERGPGYPWFHEFAVNSHGNAMSNQTSLTNDSTVATHNSQLATNQIYWTKVFAIIGHIFIILGIIAIGYFHFGNLDTGVAAAVLYLLLPYCYHFPTRLDHIVPAALLVWTLVFYRRPWLSGVLLGLASSLAYYPWFLLPLWISFYWRRGAFRFSMSSIATILFMDLTVLIFSADKATCVNYLLNMVGVSGLFIHQPQGFWDVVSTDMAYRIPVLAAYCGLCFSLIFWPSQKNLGVLLSCSTAVLMACQLVHPYQGGLYMSWYLPFLILTIFRPNLEDRIATSCVFESRFRIIPRVAKES